MISVTYTIVYPGNDDRTGTNRFMELQTAEEYINDITSDPTYRRVTDITRTGNKITIVSTILEGWCPEEIIQIIEYPDNICRVIDIPLEPGDEILQYDYFKSGDRSLPRAIQHAVPATTLVKVKRDYLQTIDNDEGYDDYMVYEVEILEKGE